MREKGSHKREVNPNVRETRHCVVKCRTMVSGGCSDMPEFFLVDTLILCPSESESGNGQPDLAWLDGCFFGCDLPLLIRTNP